MSRQSCVWPQDGAAPKVLQGYFRELMALEQGAVHVFQLRKGRLGGKAIQIIRHLAGGRRFEHKVFGFEPVDAVVTLRAERFGSF